VHLAAVHNLGGAGEVAEAGVGRGADVALVNLLALNLPHRHDVARAAGLRDLRLQLRKVDLFVLVVVGVLVGLNLLKDLFTALTAEERPHFVVAREDGAGSAQLRAHVGNDVAVHAAEAVEARAVVLNDLAHAPIHVVALQHGEDNVLRAHPVGQLPGELHAPHLRHINRVRLAGHRHGDIEAAGPDGEHADGARSRRVAVGPNQRLARLPEPLLMHRVAHAVPRPAVPRAKLLAGAAQKEVVVRVLEVGLNQVVINVLRRELSLDAGNAHRLKLQHHHRTGGVLGEGLVLHFEVDLLPHLHVLEASIGEMAVNEFLCNVFTHKSESSGQAK